MQASYYRPTRITVDLSAIKENIELHKQKLALGQSIFAVVKADAYGHGVLPVAKAAIEAGAVGFCVATLDEALELRTNGFLEPIIVLGPIDYEGLKLASEYEISIPVVDLDYLDGLIAKVQTLSLSKPLLLHLAIDSGMSRIGIRTKEELHQAEAKISAHSDLLFEGIFTHFSTADQEDDSYFKQQISMFKALLGSLSQQPKYVHVENSATTLWHETLGNIIRLGISMYGLNPSGKALESPITLRPALSLTSALTQVKFVEKGTGIGYGKTYVAQQDEWIGTVPIGYADGFIRKYQGYQVLVNGQLCEIVGRVCMDQMMIRLPEQVALGSKVTIVGRDGQQERTLQDMADYIDTIHYEVACLLSPRIPRVYIEEKR
ncbi:alanine racemase [Enterococcus cecorum]|uniref:alanine racemase n=1 Tax=Enterococcus cecorum TaxID=44008 RepID=UPI0032C482C0